MLVFCCHQRRIHYAAVCARTARTPGGLRLRCLSTAGTRAPLPSCLLRLFCLHRGMPACRFAPRFASPLCAFAPLNATSPSAGAYLPPPPPAPPCAALCLALYAPAGRRRRRMATGGTDFAHTWRCCARHDCAGRMLITSPSAYPTPLQRPTFRGGVADERARSCSHTFRTPPTPTGDGACWFFICARGVNATNGVASLHGQVSYCYANKRRITLHGG